MKDLAYIPNNKINPESVNVKASHLFFQPKLSINQPHDEYEQEADWVADKVMRMPENAGDNAYFFKPAITPLQRKCGQCEEKENLQRKEAVPAIQKQDPPATGAATPDFTLPTPSLLQPSAGPDFLSMRQPFINRNIFNLWDPNSALQVWQYNFDFFRRFGLPPDLSTTLTNITAPRFIDSQLKASNPTWWEITDRELNTSTLGASLPVLDFNADFSPVAPSWLRSIVGSGGSNVQRKCAHCEEEEKLTQRKEDTDENSALPQTESYLNNLGNAGNPLGKEERSFFEHRIGHDFSGVRLHTDSTANQSAKDINALAYTHGSNIVFGAGQYQPGTEQGKKLMAHELTHVVQQGNTSDIQRCPDPETNKAYDEKAVNVKAADAYKKLKNKTVANTIIVDAKKKDDCIFFIDKLQLLFDTEEATAEETTEQFQLETSDAVAQEEQRLSVPEEKANEGLEEAIASSPDRSYLPKKGKFGGGTYSVDNRDPNNIVVKAKVYLEKKGTGTDNDVNSIIAMEDAIEKASSTQGYIVDIEFVKVADTKTFTAFVDPSQWETATNWSGGDPRGFAHELHHMFAFPLDRYNYTSHATNARMKIPDRLHWFAEELKKPAGYNNPDSLMASGEHPVDDDVCAVAGLDVSKCVATRQNTRTVSAIRAKAFSLCFKARNILTGILPASPFDKTNEPSQNDMNKRSARSVATALFGDVSIDQVTKLVMQMQYQLTAGLLISLATLGDAACSSKETYLVNGTPPLNFCPQFFTLPEPEQVNIMLMEAARMVKLSDRSSETACASADCHTTCGGFNNAADWAKFIQCVSNL